ncbi:hypothetical protein MKW98_008559 [Papaver atlanticum]|uniref:Uncharacterized protein n=1 Tax=Papaver atlanticum TaxID=357466 RepID=A0AAD4XUP2_9MAGN|nr:hypothetical protein MKW98_008559 [Papaver atlanticum]
MPESFVPNLVHVVLHDCRACECLPPFGLLPCLKILKIDGLSAVKSIGSEFYGGSNNTNVSSFLSLESLTIAHMFGLVEWSDQVSSSPSFSSFPRLEELVEKCPKLTLMPHRFPSLKTSCFECCNGNSVSSLVEWNEFVSSLTSIEISGCDEFVSLPLGFLRGNKILRRLKIVHCEKFKGFSGNIDLEDGNKENEFSDQVIIPNNAISELVLMNCGPSNICLDFRGFDSLWNLQILFRKSEDCISGKEYVIKRKTGIECLPKLETLKIGVYSGNLVADPFPFPEADIKEENGSVTGNYFPSLRELTLWGWTELECVLNYVLTNSADKSFLFFGGSARVVG